MTWIQTYSGKKFWPLNPMVDSVDIGDIAHALSLQCRFSGNTYKHYSVAQHCVLVSYVCDEVDALWGLLHDASEAYLVDLPRPLKEHSEVGKAYKVVEERVMAVICDAFRLGRVMPSSVGIADEVVLATEARDLMGGNLVEWGLGMDPLDAVIEPWSSRYAEDTFLTRFRALYH